MKITRILVEGLFGYLNYKIEINRNEDITIIHGPNGCGKTTILELTCAVFRSDYSILRQVPFHSFSIRFDNTGHLRIIKETEEHVREIHGRKRTIKSAKLTYTYSKKGMKERSHKITTDLHDERLVPFSRVERWIPELQRIGAREWRSRKTGEELTWVEVGDRYPEQLPVSVREKLRPKWLIDVIEQIEVYFIRAQRLIRRSTSQTSEIRSTPEESLTDTIEIYAQELGKIISDKLAESGSVFQSFDRTFLTMLLNRTPTPTLNENSLRKFYLEIESKRQALTEVGLIDLEPLVPLPEYKMNAMEKRILELYLPYVVQNLQLFDDLVNKLTAFIEIINGKMWETKLMRVDRKNGFNFHPVPPGDPILEPRNLSSGEQHQVVLFYELLFNAHENSLILIDEPEISLHVEWQRQFLKDLSRVTSFSNHSFLIATHSPQIIHDRWDLAVALGGGVDDE